VVPEGPVSQPSFEEGLRQIGLEAEWVRAAVGDGNLERKRVLGSHNGPSAQGFYAWNGILASLTLTVQGFGWERHNPLCLPVLIERSKKNIVFISSGDQYTGKTGTGKQVPRSRNPKGPVVAALSQQNKKLLGREQTLDFPANAQKSAEYELMEVLLGCTTYVLLVHFSKRDLEARYEVSRLEDLNPSSYLSVQYPRWIAPAYPLKAEDFDHDDPNEGFDGPPKPSVLEKG
jgi:hypothetical protein